MSTITVLCFVAIRKWKNLYFLLLSAKGLFIHVCVVAFPQKTKETERDTDRQRVKKNERKI